MKGNTEQLSGLTVIISQLCVIVNQLGLRIRNYNLLKSSLKMKIKRVGSVDTVDSLELPHLYQKIETFNHILKQRCEKQNMKFDRDFISSLANRSIDNKVISRNTIKDLETLVNDESQELLEILGKVESFSHLVTEQATGTKHRSMTEGLSCDILDVSDSCIINEIDFSLPLYQYQEAKAQECELI